MRRPGAEESSSPGCVWKVRWHRRHDQHFPGVCENARDVHYFALKSCMMLPGPRTEAAVSRHLHALPRLPSVSHAHRPGSCEADDQAHGAPHRERGLGCLGSPAGSISALFLRIR
eukprot:1923370-Rhodomonas_salina.5